MSILEATGNTDCKQYRCGKRETRQNPLLRRPIRLCLLGVLLLIFSMGSGCPVVIVVPAPLEFVISMNSNRFARGERVRISWQFENNLNQDGSHKVTAQQVEFVGHSLIRLDLPPRQFPLNACTREIEFEYMGPMTVTLGAGNASGLITTATIDISNREESFATSFVRPTNNRYPRLGELFRQTQIGQPVERITSRLIEFYEFVAIHDKDDDGLIDQFAAFPELAGLFSRETDSRGHSLHVDQFSGLPDPSSQFPAFELLAPDTQQLFFRNTQGLRFPEVPAALRETVGRDRCNAIIFAGAFVYGGYIDKPPKLDTNEEAQPVIQNALDYEPVFS